MINTVVKSVERLLNNAVKLTVWPLANPLSIRDDYRGQARVEWGELPLNHSPSSLLSLEGRRLYQKTKTTSE